MGDKQVSDLNQRIEKLETKFLKLKIIVVVGSAALGLLLVIGAEWPTKSAAIESLRAAGIETQILNVSPQEEGKSGGGATTIMADEGGTCVLLSHGANSDESKIFICTGENEESHITFSNKKGERMKIPKAINDIKFRLQAHEAFYHSDQDQQGDSDLDNEARGSVSAAIYGSND